MQEAVPVGEGAMAAILGLDVEGVTRACAETEAGHPGRVVTLANLNAPGQIVIAGHADAVALAGERAKALGATRAIGLAVSAPFHCPLMKPAEDRLAPELRALAGGRSANPRRRQRRCRAEARCRLVDRGADPSGVVPGALGRRRQAADCRRDHDLRRDRAGQGAGGVDPEDRPQRDGAERRGRERARGARLAAALSLHARPLTRQMDTLKV